MEIKKIQLLSLHTIYKFTEKSLVYIIFLLKMIYRASLSSLFYPT